MSVIVGVVASTNAFSDRVTEKVAIRLDWQFKIRLVYTLDHLATFRAIQREMHHKFPNGPNLRKDQVEEKQVTS